MSHARSTSLGLALALGLFPAAFAAAAERSFDSFHARSADLATTSDLFYGGSGARVTFDAAAAAEKGVSKDGIALAEELSAFTNALEDAAKAMGTDDITAVKVDLAAYPRLAAYFDDAAAYSKLPSTDPKPDVAVQSWLSEYTCGAFWRPRPSKSGAPWKRFYSSNPSATLSAWGYHPTPGLAGGGWTRPQTWTWPICGFSTYRDHAYVYPSTTINEQNYAGWTPRGEPNPEVYRSGPWPYPSWPAYVYWWHQY